MLVFNYKKYFIKLILLLLLISCISTASCSNNNYALNVKQLYDAMLPFEFEKHGFNKFDLDFSDRKLTCDNTVAVKELEFSSLSLKATSIANNLVGLSGDCFYIASLFVDMFYSTGHNIKDAYVVNNPLPGDLIYYEDGGKGIEHWAIYLDKNLALHGNFNGVAVIRGVELNLASGPIFMRIP